MQIASNMWRKVFGSVETNILSFGLFVDDYAHHLEYTSHVRQWLLVAASCCRQALLQQKQESWVEQNTEHTKQKICLRLHKTWDGNWDSPSSWTKISRTTVESFKFYWCVRMAPLKSNLNVGGFVNLSLWISRYMESKSFDSRVRTETTRQSYLSLLRQPLVSV